MAPWTLALSMASSADVFFFLWVMSVILSGRLGSGCKLTLCGVVLVLAHCEDVVRALLFVCSWGFPAGLLVCVCVRERETGRERERKTPTFYHHFKPGGRNVAKEFVIRLTTVQYFVLYIKESFSNERHESF